MELVIWCGGAWRGAGFDVVGAGTSNHFDGGSAVAGFYNCVLWRLENATVSPLRQELQALPLGQ